MKISFLDSGVLVTAARSIGELSEKALSILEDLFRAAIATKNWFLLRISPFN